MTITPRLFHAKFLLSVTGAFGCHCKPNLAITFGSTAVKATMGSHGNVQLIALQWKFITFTGEYSYLASTQANDQIGNKRIFGFTTPVRDHHTPTCTLSKFTCLNRFSHRADLVDFEQQAIACFLLDGLANSLRVCNRQIITTSKKNNSKQRCQMKHSFKNKSSFENTTRNLTSKASYLGVLFQYIIYLCLFEASYSSIFFVKSFTVEEVVRISSASLCLLVQVSLDT